MGVQIEALGQLDQRGIAADGREGDLGLEGGDMVTTGSTGHGKGSEAEGRKIVRGARLSTPWPRSPANRMLAQGWFQLPLMDGHCIARLRPPLLRSIGSTSCHENAWPCLCLTAEPDNRHPVDEQMAYSYW